MGTVSGKLTTVGGKSVFTISIQKDSKDACVKHIMDAHKKGAVYHKTTKKRAKQNRRDSLRGKKKVKGKDLDEWPMAMFREGGKGASIRAINPSQNRSMGSRLGRLTRGLGPNVEIRIRFVR